jgi:hypothetical protein
MGKQLWDERRPRAIAEVQATIKAAFPEATFKVYQGTDPEGIYIDAYTRADDGFEILDLISERLVDVCVEEGLGIYVVPLPKEKP